MKYFVRISVIVILKKGEKALFTRRVNTGYEDNKYEFVSGHLEKSENVFEAAIREVKEEIDISINKEDLNFIGCIDKSNTVNHINFVFEVKDFEGEPKIIEKDQCDDYQYANIESKVKLDLSVDAVQAIEIYKTKTMLKSY